MRPETFWNNLKSQVIHKRNNFHKNYYVPKYLIDFQKILLTPEFRRLNVYPERMFLVLLLAEL